MIQYEARREEKSNWNWVVRDNNGNFIDSDRYRNDLKERLELQEISIIFIGD